MAHTFSMGEPCSLGAVAGEVPVI